MHLTNFTAAAVLISAMSLGACLSELNSSDDHFGDSTNSSSGNTSSTGSSSGTSTDRCSVIKASIEDAGFNDAVSVNCESNHAYLTSDTYPNHTVMTGITGTNEQTAVPAPGFTAPIPLNPNGVSGATTRDSALGVAINGVPIYDYTSQGELNPDGPYDPKSDVVVTGQLDICGGHAGRGDDYHYHKAPNCMMDAMANKGDGAIIGWAYDGYPLYGFNNPDGTTIADGELDKCNGRADEDFGYRYHASTTPPYVFQCLRGAVDVDALPRVAPLKNQAGSPPKPDGNPPQGGVDSLTFLDDGQGKRSMSYDYMGQSYFIDYEETATPGCYLFEMKTISFGELAGTYCRD